MTDPWCTYGQIIDTSRENPELAKMEIAESYKLKNPVAFCDNYGI